RAMPQNPLHRRSIDSHCEQNLAEQGPQTLKSNRAYTGTPPHRFEGTVDVSRFACRAVPPWGLLPGYGGFESHCNTAKFRACPTGVKWSRVQILSSRPLLAQVKLASENIPSRPFVPPMGMGGNAHTPGVSPANHQGAQLLPWRPRSPWSEGSRTHRGRPSPKTS